ncbi:alpha/beta fold hydrolase [Labedella populi]|uniref:Alpha/beta fold hydrolase n=4 Tax=Labedella TaxID=390250 RepID=A0A444Q0M6_9MICO|nr:alpha/beta fold hydrolase [Labedella populi]
MTKPRSSRRPWLRRALLAVASVLVAGVALIGGAYLYLVPAPSVAEPALSGSLGHEALQVDGMSRTYLSYVPADVPDDAPVLVVLHGSFQSGETIRTATGFEFDQLADARGFVVVYPDGYGQGWNDCRELAATPARQENVSDVRFINDIVAEMSDRYGTSADRYFAVGYSNGGQMALRLASEAPERLRGLALISANIPTADNNLCSDVGSDVPTVVMSGTADPISPFEGGPVTIFGFSPRGNVVSAAETTQAFVRSNGISAEASTHALAHRDESGETSVSVVDFREPGKAPVRQYIIEGGGHVVPTRIQGFGRIFGASTFDVDAPTEIWDFIAAER